MKKILLLLIFSNIACGQKQQLDVKAESEKLFNGHWDISSEEVVWKPNLEETLLFPMVQESKDGKCHTKIAQQLKHESTLILIFATHFEGANIYAKEGSPTSIAEYHFDKNAKKWKIVAFDKHVTSDGFENKPNLFEILIIGEHLFLKEISRGDFPFSRYGGEVETTTLYKRKGAEFAATFSYCSFQSNETVEEIGYEHSTTLSINSEGKIILRTQGTIEGDDGKVISANKEDIYSVSEAGDFTLDGK